MFEANNSSLLITKLIPSKVNTKSQLSTLLLWSVSASPQKHCGDRHIVFTETSKSSSSGQKAQKKQGKEATYIEEVCRNLVLELETLIFSCSA